MLSTFEVILNSFVVFLLPLAVHSLITRKLPPGHTFLGRLYRTSPYLLIVSDVFLLALCFSCLGRLALHFGFIPMSQAGRVELITSVPFMTLLVIFLGFLIRGLVKMRRAARSEATNPSASE